MNFKVPIFFLSEKVIAFLFDDNFQPEVLFSTERQYFLNRGALRETFA